MTFLPPGLVQLVQKCNHGIIIVLAGTLPESRKCVEGSGEGGRERREREWCWGKGKTAKGESKEGGRKKTFYCTNISLFPRPPPGSSSTIHTVESGLCLDKLGSSWFCTIFSFQIYTHLCVSVCQQATAFECSCNSRLCVVPRSIVYPVTCKHHLYNAIHFHYVRHTYCIHNYWYTRHLICMRTVFPRLEAAAIIPTSTWLLIEGGYVLLHQSGRVHT